MLTPLWLDGPRGIRPPLTHAGHYDIVVAGGGLSGLLAGLLLARSGRRVAILEARKIGDGTTGRSTAKVSLLQGRRLSTIQRHGPLSLARQYVDGSREGQAWIRRFLEDHAVPHQVRPAYTHAVTPEGRGRLEREALASAAAGLGAKLVDECELPFPVLGALLLDDQLQVDPMLLLGALVDQFENDGGELFEGTRLAGAHPSGDGVELRTDAGVRVTAGHLVVATGAPVIDRSCWFARLEAQRSYALAAEGTAAPQGMYLSIDDEVRSIRSTPGPDGDLLLVGGNGHPTGRGPSEDSQLRELEEWTTATFAGAAVTHRWSAQDFQSSTGLPYAGPLTPRDDRILVMTGYAKWGFTTSVASALIISKTVLGTRPAWGEAWSTWSSHDLKALPALLGWQLGVGAQMAGGHLSRGPLRHLPGASGAPAPVCTHLGGRLRWNDAEQTWDCPLHGSRFAADGQVLDGPAVRPLQNPVRPRDWTDPNPPDLSGPGASQAVPPEARP